MGEIKNYIVRDDKLMGNGAFGPRFFLPMMPERRSYRCDCPNGLGRVFSAQTDSYTYQLVAAVPDLPLRFLR